MDVEQVHAIERECANVVTQCGRHADQHEFEKAAALITPDVVFKGGGSDPLVGREAIIASMHANIADLFRRRVIKNMVVTVHDADHATATAYWLMYSYKTADVADGKVSTAAPTHFCESEDKLVRMDEGWRIAQRYIKFVL